MIFIKMIIDFYVLLGVEEELAYYTHFAGSKKPNIIYRIYKRVNRRFRNEMDEYVSSASSFDKKSKNYSKWRIFNKRNEEL